MSTLSPGVARAALRTAAADEAARTAVRVLEPRSGWVAIGWGELWEYRELLGFLVWRDVKVRYKQTVLGAAWAVLQPLMTMVMFTLLFGRWAKMPSDGLPYQVFAFAALLPWTFFSNAVSSAAASLVGNTHLISKVYFPRLLIAMASIGTGLVDFAVALGVMLVLLVYYRVGLTWHLAAIPLLTVLMLMICVRRRLAARRALRHVSRRALRRAAADAVVDVRLAGDLFGHARAGAVALAVLPEPACRRHRRIPFGAARPAVQLARRSACRPSSRLLSLWIGFAVLPRVERRVADLL